MTSFSIQQLENWTLIKGHTLRIWEQRYEAFAPQRTSANLRAYGEDDMQRALHLALLARHNYKISQVAGLSLVALRELADPYLTSNQSTDNQLTGLLIALTDRDQPCFAQRLQTYWQQLGGVIMLERVVLPLLSRISQVWGSDFEALGERKFMLTILEEKLVNWIEQLPPAQQTGSTCLVVQPGPQPFQLWLRIAQYLLIKRSHRVINLKPDLSVDAIRQAISTYLPQYLLIVLAGWPALHQVQSYIDELADACQGTELLLSGSRIVGQDLLLPAGSRLINQLMDLTRLS